MIRSKEIVGVILLLEQVPKAESLLLMIVSVSVIGGLDIIIDSLLLLLHVKIDERLLLMRSRYC